MADEFKAEGNKAFTEKRFDEAMWDLFTLEPKLPTNLPQ